MKRNELTAEERALAIKIWAQLNDVTIARGKLILSEVMGYAKDLTVMVEETHSIGELQKAISN